MCCCDALATSCAQRADTVSEPAVSSAATSPVAVVVIHYCQPESLRRTLAALSAQSLKPAKVLVVDNGDGSSCRVVAAEFGVDLHAMHANPGFAAAANVGLALLTSEFDAVLVLSHDAELAEGALDALVDTLALHPGAAIVGPILGNGRARDHVWSAGGGRRRWSGLPYHRAADMALRDVMGSTCEDVEWVDGACMLVRATAYRTVGGLDESWFLYVEELDWQLRLRRAGWRILCDRRAVACQWPGLMPPYLEARNLLRLSIRERNLLGAVVLVGRELRMMARAIAQGRAWELRVRSIGLLHGLTGGLDLTAAARRSPQ